jgi:energy-coupling factor transport system substrate-specific component
MLTAVGVILGYLFLSIPNVELVTATVFIAGFFLGPLFGFIVGILTEFIYSALNPMGMAAPNLLIAQILGMALAGYVGGIARQTGWYEKAPLVRIILFGTAGFLITLIFDVLTTLSFTLIMSGGDLNKILSSFLFGMTFYFIHIIINTVVFAILVPLLISRLSQFVNYE